MRISKNEIVQFLESRNVTYILPEGKLSNAIWNALAGKDGEIRMGEGLGTQEKSKPLDNAAEERRFIRKIITCKMIAAILLFKGASHFEFHRKKTIYIPTETRLL